MIWAAWGPRWWASGPSRRAFSMMRPASIWRASFRACSPTPPRRTCRLGARFEARPSARASMPSVRAPRDLVDRLVRDQGADIAAVGAIGEDKGPDAAPPPRSRPPPPWRGNWRRPGGSGRPAPGSACLCSPGSFRQNLGQPGGQLGHQHQDHDEDAHHPEHRQGSTGYEGHVLACHALQYEEVETDRRRYLRHLHHDHQIDAEPEDVEAGGAHHRLDHRHGQHDRGEAVEEAAQQDVEDGQDDDQHDRGELPIGDALGQGLGNPGEAHGERQEAGAHQDQHDHRRRAHRSQDALDEAVPTERALRQGEKQGADDTQGRRLGRGREAGIDRADHEADQQQDRQEVDQALQLCLADQVVGLRNPALVDDAPAGDVEHEEQGQADARNHRAMKSLAMLSFTVTRRPIMEIEGGIKRPKVPAPERVPMIMRSGYLRSVSSGSTSCRRWRPSPPRSPRWRRRWPRRRCSRAAGRPAAGA